MKVVIDGCISIPDIQSETYTGAELKELAKSFDIYELVNDNLMQRLYDNETDSLLDIGDTDAWVSEDELDTWYEFALDYIIDILGEGKYEIVSVCFSEYEPYCYDYHATLDIDYETVYEKYKENKNN